MKKYIQLSAICLITLNLFFIKDVKAQITTAKHFNFNLGLETGVPTGQIRPLHTFELGGTLRVQYGVTNNVTAMFTTGFYNLMPKDFIISYTTPFSSGTVAGRSEALGVIPVKLGVKWTLVKSFYVSAEGGAWCETKPSQHNGGYFYNDTKLLLSPGIGFATESLDIGMRYESSSGKGHDYGLIGLRIAHVL